MGKSMGLEMYNADVEELVEEQVRELTTEGLEKLHNEQQRLIQAEEDPSDEEEKEPLPSATIKDICAKWGKVQSFIDKHHPYKAETSRAVNILNDNVRYISA